MDFCSTLTLGLPGMRRWPAESSSSKTQSQRGEGFWGWDFIGMCVGVGTRYQVPVSETEQSAPRSAAWRRSPAGESDCRRGERTPSSERASFFMPDTGDPQKHICPRAQWAQIVARQDASPTHLVNQISLPLWPVKTKTVAAVTDTDKPAITKRPLMPRKMRNTVIYVIEFSNAAAASLGFPC